MAVSHSVLLWKASTRGFQSQCLSQPVEECIQTLWNAEGRVDREDAKKEL